RVGRALWHRNDRTASRRAPKADARWSPSASLPPTLASRTTFRLAASFSAARDSLGVPRRELLRHGSSRLHANPVQVFMRPVLVSAWPQDRSEQFRPSILSPIGDHNGGDEHFLSLFQVL